MAETIKKYIKYNILSLKFAGLWTNSASLFSSKYYWIYSLLVQVVIMGTFNAVQVVNLVTLFDDLEKLASSAYVVLSWVQASAKACCYLKNWSLIGDIFVQLDQKEFQPKNERQKQIFFSVMRIHIWVHVLYTIMAIVFPPLWILFPILVKSTDRKLPFPAWYPYDWRHGLYYYLSYTHQSIGLYFVILNNYCQDLITWGILAYIGAECDILSDTLRNLYGFTGKNLLHIDSEALLRKTKDKQTLDEMNTTLIRCIHHHWKILKFAKDCNSLLSLIILIMFASTVLSVCMTLFELTVISPNSFEFLIMGLYQMAIIMQLSINCWFGNEVVVKSNKISPALYECAWIECPPVFKRNMTIFLLATQKPIQLYGINFFALSLTTFMAILRTCWSVFAMLYQVHNKHPTY